LPKSGHELFRHSDEREMNRTGKTHGMIGLGTMGLQMARQ